MAGIREELSQEVYNVSCKYCEQAYCELIQLYEKAIEEVNETPRFEEVKREPYVVRCVLGGKDTYGGGRSFHYAASKAARRMIFCIDHGKVLMRGTMLMVPKERQHQALEHWDEQVYNHMSELDEFHDELETEENWLTELRQKMASMEKEMDILNIRLRRITETVEDNEGQATE